MYIRLILGSIFFSKSEQRVSAAVLRYPSFDRSSLCNNALSGFSNGLTVWCWQFEAVRNCRQPFLTLLLIFLSLFFSVGHIKVLMLCCSHHWPCYFCFSKTQPQFVIINNSMKNRSRPFPVAYFVLLALLNHLIEVLCHMFVIEVIFLAPP